MAAAPRILNFVMRFLRNGGQKNGCRRPRFRFRVVRASNRCEVLALAFWGSMDFMPTRDVDYRCEEVNLRGYLSWNESAEPRPGVLVFHEGLGLGEFAMERARRLAGLGYVALAADMFGERRQARNLQEVTTLVGGLRAEPNTAPRPRPRGRSKRWRRMAASRRAAPVAIGFCFAVRWCWSSRAPGAISRPWSVSTACWRRKCRRSRAG